MGKVLPFVTREQYKLKELEDILQPTPVINPDIMETFKKLYTIAMHDLDYMVTELKKTGHWNNIADQLIRRVYEDVKVICATLVGENNGSNTGSTEKT